MRAEFPATLNLEMTKSNISLARSRSFMVSNEIKEKLKTAMIKAHKRKKWGFKKGNDLWKRVKFTDELRAKRREARSKLIFTKAIREKISKALIGRAFSKEHKKNLSLAWIGKGLGKKNPWWKGGQNLSYWKKAIKRRDGKCMKCGINDMRILTADHIKSKKMYPELIYNTGNGITLCHNCLCYSRTYPTITYQ